MKCKAYSSASKRECYLQEAVYYIMSELQLGKIFPGVVNANNNIPLKHVKKMLSKKHLVQLIEDSTDI